MQIVNNENFNNNELYKLKSKILSQASNIYHEMILFEEVKNKDNFFVLENEKVIAVVPLYFEKILKTRILVGSYLNLSIPGPIILENLNDKKFKRLISLILEEIDLRSIKHGIKNLKINFSDTISHQVGSQKYFSLLEKLSLYNFKNSFSIGLRIDLKKSLKEILKNFSKGHRSEIKKQSNQEYSFLNYHKKKIEYEEFKSFFYQSKRNNNDIKMLHELYKKNKVYTVFLKNEKEDIFCGLFTIAGNTVEYFFSKSSSNHHSLIVAAINFFKKIKFLEFLNFGVVNTLNSFELLSKKKNNIALFKKGFGGEKFKYMFFEKEY